MFVTSAVFPSLPRRGHSSFQYLFSPQRRQVDDAILSANVLRPKPRPFLPPFSTAFGSARPKASRLYFVSEATASCRVGAEAGCKLGLVLNPFGDAVFILQHKDCVIVSLLGTAGDKQVLVKVLLGPGCRPRPSCPRSRRNSPGRLVSFLCRCLQKGSSLTKSAWRSQSWEPQVSPHSRL